MKKVAFLSLLVVILLGGCKKLKLTDNPYLKINVAGTDYEYNEDQIEGGIIKAEDQVEEREVFFVRTSGQMASKPVFFVQSRTDLTLNIKNPIMKVMPGDEVGLIMDGKTYELVNGTLNPEKISLVVGIGGYLKGVFNVTLRNKADFDETIQVSGSYFHNNY